jgi:uncharacterized protein (DUF433 family)
MRNDPNDAQPKNGMPTPPIINNRIAGTRITIWDIVHYLENGESPEQIAEALGLTVEQVRDAVQYIDTHKTEVMAVHHTIEERIARGNPPELQAKLDASRARFLEVVEKVRRRKAQEATGAGDSRGQ